MFLIKFLLTLFALKLFVVFLKFDAKNQIFYVFYFCNSVLFFVFVAFCHFFFRVACSAFFCVSRNFFLSSNVHPRTNSCRSSRVSTVFVKRFCFSSTILKSNFLISFNFETANKIAIAKFLFSSLLNFFSSITNCLYFYRSFPPRRTSLTSKKFGCSSAAGANDF